MTQEFLPSLSRTVSLSNPFGLLPDYLAATKRGIPRASVS